MLLPIAAVLVACAGCSTVEEGEERAPSSTLHPSIEVFGAYESIQSESLHLSGASIGSFSAAPLGRIGDGTLGAHSALHLLPWLTVGFEGALGGGGIPSIVLRSDPAVTTGSVALHARVGGFVGVTSPRLGPFDARAEVLAGGRLYVMDVQERYGCTHDGCDGLSGGAWMVQPKGILEAWLTTHVTIGASVGADLVHPGDWSTALFIGVHQTADR